MPPSPIPLEAGYVFRTISVVVAGQLVSGIAKANWGEIEVTVTSPIAGPTRGWNGRCWSFAMLAGYRPQERFACQGEFTEKGVARSERLLAEIYRDYLLAGAASGVGGSNGTETT